MTDLPRLIQADCGHWISAETPPAGSRILDTVGYMGPSRTANVYLCNQCKARLSDSPSQIGTNVVIKRGPGRPRKVQP